MTIAVKYLHDSGRVHGDIKPHNILVYSLNPDDQVVCKLSDYWDIKQITGVSTDIITDEEMISIAIFKAPEVLKGEGHGIAVDWWGLGIVVYEMFAGYTPFDVEDDPKQTYQNILSGDIEYDPAIPGMAQDFIGQLLERNPSKRLKEEAVKEHPWFDCINFDDLENKKVKPPFIPDVKSDDEKGDDSKDDSIDEDVEVERADVSIIESLESEFEYENEIHESLVSLFDLYELDNLDSEV